MLRGDVSAAFEQCVVLEAGVAYRASVYTRWTEIPDRSANAVIQETGGANKIAALLPKDTAWQETAFTYTPIKTGEHKFFIWTPPGIGANLYLDTVSIRLEQRS